MPVVLSEREKSLPRHLHHNIFFPPFMDSSLKDLQQQNKKHLKTVEVEEEDEILRNGIK